LAEIILFGGTSEGRLIAEALNEKGLDALLCVASDYGEMLLPDNMRVNAGKLSLADIKQLFGKERPRTVIDATHPYAAEISENIRLACDAPKHIRYIRVEREAIQTDGCIPFTDIAALTLWLETQDGIIFSALGAKEASALSDFKERVWLRILPDINSLNICLDAGFRPKHIICMQGPFDRELNAAMFRHANARILLTKESGEAGGFAEKAAAAKDCGMEIAVLSRPHSEQGVTLPAILKLLRDGRL